ncbi:hypothetical protein [Polluticaenibacter yanchengensis]|uniref:WYL domain-containing protein n=1 Tax=Polluticaenibacter yanchengensis TaxID=3014562 RepID=A0ABT4UK68_9BACT|nr:hypothetical protein [Chitinophagaceae bacterium LY-5]
MATFIEAFEHLLSDKEVDYKGVRLSKAEETHPILGYNRIRLVGHALNTFWVPTEDDLHDTTYELIVPEVIEN